MGGIVPERIRDHIRQAAIGLRHSPVILPGRAVAMDIGFRALLDDALGWRLGAGRG